jgi:hypothetical protein
VSEPYRKKLIEVALPLETIDRASAREQSFQAGRREGLDRTVLELAQGPG